VCTKTLTGSGAAVGLYTWRTQFGVDGSLPGYLSLAAEPCTPSSDAPDLSNRKPRESRAKLPSREDARFHLMKNRLQNRPNNTPRFCRTSVPSSAKAARVSIATDTTPVSQSRQIGVQSGLGFLLK